MAFRVTYEALREMVGRIALNVSFARKIVRKSGLRPGAATTGPRTLIDAFVDTNETALWKQWATDLTGFSGVRFTCQSFIALYVFYSHTLDGSYDPGDWAPLEGEEGAVSASIANSTGDLRWFTLPAERKAPIRLTISTQPDSYVTENSVQCSIALQAR